MDHGAASDPVYADCALCGDPTPHADLTPLDRTRFQASSQGRDSSAVAYLCPQCLADVNRERA